MILKKISLNLFILFMILMLTPTNIVKAEVFESFNGNFNFNMPDNWSRLDYRTADYYLSQAGRGSAYEAVFVETDAPSIFEGAYLILTIDSLGDQSQSQIDSILQVMGEGIERPIKNIDVDSLFATPDGDNILYSDEMKFIAIYSDLDTETDIPRKSLLISKFYEKGIANFYFYAPLPLFESALPAFKEMITTFAIGRLNRQAGDEVKVSDLKNSNDLGDNEDPPQNIMIFGGLFIIMLIVVITARRKKRQKTA